MTGNFPLPLCALLVALRSVVLSLVLWHVWVAVSPRGTKVENSRLMAVNRAQWLFGCSQARFQLSNAHSMTFQLAGTSEIWVRAGFEAFGSSELQIN